jgi:hypothetical protein
MNFGVNLGCTVTTISCKNSGAVITLKLNDVPIGITVRTSKVAVEDLNLKKNDCAYATFSGGTQKNLLFLEAGW